MTAVVEQYDDDPRDDDEDAVDGGERSGATDSDPDQLLADACDRHGVIIYGLAKRLGGLTQAQSDRDILDDQPMFW